MKRWLFNIAAGGSLLAGVLVIALWIHSESHYAWVDYDPPPTSSGMMRAGISTVPGAIGIGRWIVTWPPRSDAGVFEVAVDAQIHKFNIWRHGSWSCGTTPPNWAPMSLPFERFWFGWTSSQTTATSGILSSVTEITTVLSIPDWFLILLSLILPVFWLIRFRQRHKLAGCCAKCGYDLRATPERCPECGTVSAEHEKEISNLV